MVARSGPSDQVLTGRILLGERLRQIRQERGLDIRAVAEAAQLSQSHVSQIERGKSLPPLGTLVALSGVYGVLPVDILAGIYPFGERRKPSGRVTPVKDGRRRD